MNEKEFKEWLKSRDFSLKVQQDTLSRVKRLERALPNVDIDKQYRKDGCAHLLSILKHKGLNDNMKKLGTVDLPIGQNGMHAIKFSLNTYIRFLNDTQSK